MQPFELINKTCTRLNIFASYDHVFYEHNNNISFIKITIIMNIVISK